MLKGTFNFHSTEACIVLCLKVQYIGFTKMSVVMFALSTCGPGEMSGSALGYDGSSRSKGHQPVLPAHAYCS